MPFFMPVRRRINDDGSARTEIRQVEGERHQERLDRRSRSKASLTNGDQRPVEPGEEAEDEEQDADDQHRAEMGASDGAAAAWLPCGFSPELAVSRRQADRDSQECLFIRRKVQRCQFCRLRVDAPAMRGPPRRLAHGIVDECNTIRWIMPSVHCHAIISHSCRCSGKPRYVAPAMTHARIECSRTRPVDNVVIMPAHSARSGAPAGAVRGLVSAGHGGAEWRRRQPASCLRPSATLWRRLRRAPVPRRTSHSWRPMSAARMRASAWSRQAVGAAVSVRIPPLYLRRLSGLRRSCRTSSGSWRHAARALRRRAAPLRVACAGYVLDGAIINANLPWPVSLREIRDGLGLSRLEVINDFEAVATPPSHRSDETRLITQAGSGSPGRAGGRAGHRPGRGGAAPGEPRARCWPPKQGSCRLRRAPSARSRSCACCAASAPRVDRKRAVRPRPGNLYARCANWPAAARAARRRPK